MRNVAIVGAGMTSFGEHFGLGIKDLVPMAYAAAAAHVDKGIDKSDIEAAWFGELSTTDGFPSGILADTLDLVDIPVTRVEMPVPQAMTPSAMQRWRSLPVRMTWPW